MFSSFAYKRGPTQADGTELFDGISLSIRSGRLNDLTFEQVVSQNYQKNKDEPAIDQISEQEAVTIAGINGVQFRIQGIGKSTYIFLPKGETEFLQIIDSTVEPEDRQPQTFKETVTTMFSTLEFKTN